MRVLVLEDEPLIRHQLVERLRKEGFAVDPAEDGREGLFLGGEIDFDVAVIDLGLPDMSGMEVIRRLRERDRRFPILILTARGRWQDKVEGLDAGADDYLVKPFEVEELLARLNALQRRAAGWSQPVLHFGPIAIDTKAQSVQLDGEEVEMTSYEYKVLEYLATHAGKVVSKTELTEHIYDQDFDRDSNVIEVFIGRLRKKLDRDNRLKPIETLSGRGYKFAIKETVA